MSTAASNSPCDILLVEDNPADVEMVMEWMQERRYMRNLCFATDGKAALALLKRHQSVGCPPSLIVLDINLPGMNGIEVLRALKADKVLRKIPVVVLTSSEARDDVERCYELQANAYVLKTADLDALYLTLDGIHNFWFGIATLPNRSNNPSDN